MNSIEQQVINNYNENMSYLEKNYEAVFTKVKALEILMEEGELPQKYDLEYRNGYFDVIDLSSKNFLYNQDSNIYSDKLAKQISFKKNEQVFETFYNYDFSDKALDKSKTNDAMSMYSNSAEIIQYYNNNIHKTDSLKSINKIIFIGLGLGLHLNSVLNTTNSNSILIIEDDIELFRLSLFVNNYKQILDGKIAFFSIAHTKEEFKNIFYSFYLDSFVRNHFIKFSLFSDAYEQKIQMIQELIISRTEKTYPHEFLLHKNKQVLKRINEKYNFLNLKSDPSLNIFADKPALIIGAGPSLDKNLKWLSKYADEFIIFAALASIPTLKKQSITPDFVLQIDEKVLATTKLLDKIGDVSILKDAICIFSASVPDTLFKLFPSKNIFLTEDRTNYFSEHQKIEAASIGEYMYAISLYLNAKNIYFLGLDLAISDDGSTHTDNHQLNKKLDISSSEKLNQNISLDKSTFHVKGNFREKVLTTPLFAMSIPYINFYTSVLKKDSQKVFNLNDGAYFENVIPFKTDAYVSTSLTTPINKKNILDYLKSISSHKLTQADRKSKILTYKQAIEKFYESASSDDITFIRNYTEMLSIIFNSQRNELQEILSIYILNTSTYIVDFFNTRELKNQKKHIKNMKKMIYKNMKEIVNFYDSMIDEIVQ
ncbi:motility associated factor glycosyltransferase family protein [Sulfurimonas lithotrophica]|uniref:Motility associated factor glycosyltransferase family protein n=1 Tax=Sulfurimonas lithotrophica TaxID=2590022 RepID=A0A5P8NY55_9BACT|nr:6-hydroxymethylpterin diphosphokinase MptE-like protein [Sulfurimonas lithotrophica]QFR48340.1 motility associated factor glycosyltransferase family protein [Sulfurimonas lithotrophica]